MCSIFLVIPAKAGIQMHLERLDSRLRGNDGRTDFSSKFIRLHKCLISQRGCGSTGNNPVVTFEDILLSGICPQDKVITRIWTATDDCANTAASSQTITVIDTKAPNIHNLTADPAVLWPPNHIR